MIEDSGQESLQQNFKSGGKPSRQVGDVTALSSDGRAIVKSRGKTYFAERVVPGDRVAFAPDETTSPARAANAKVLKRSELRCDHPCRHAAECPASQWGIVKYETQLAEKTELVRRVLRGIVAPESVSEMWASPEPWGYRNRLTLTVYPKERGAVLGYAVGARGAGFAEIRTCLLATRSISQAVGHVGWILRDARQLSASALPTRLVFFETAFGPGAMALFSDLAKETDVQEFLELAQKFELPGGILGATASKAGIVGERGTFWREEESRAMITTWLGNRLEIHPAGFAQINEGAFDRVLGFLQQQSAGFEASAVWDLYGGYGALGFAAARAGTRLTVIEQSGFSRKTFDQLAGFHPQVKSKFTKSEVLAALPNIASKMTDKDLVILDPPYSGCHPDVLKALSGAAIRKLVYLSCNPARLARDLKILAPAGFQSTLIQPVDFFPQTPEIEVLVFAER
ncbi:MAG: class I SAM-dependent RNA methyltransferase [Calditrichaeota bacterium]|nr:class I SAM-dependent RNA methyltransferase [Calditrichota bacterium]MCB9368953.1 class I SAM-dependent RNA methyltransferase [Calditrichota bacterium]